MKVGRIITHRQEFCQAVRSSETTMNILNISPEAIQDYRDEIDIWNVPAVHGIIKYHPRGTRVPSNVSRVSENATGNETSAEG